MLEKAGTSVLGMDLFRALGLSIVGNSVLSPAAPVSEVEPGPVTGVKLGLAKDFLHRVKVKEGNEAVQPVQQKLRRLPLSVRQAVSTELERLLQMDVIED